MKEYTVAIGGVDHTLLLDEDDAKRYGASESAEVQGKSSAPANKSRSTGEK